MLFVHWMVRGTRIWYCARSILIVVSDVILWCFMRISVETRWGVHWLGARHEKLGTYNLYVEENTEAAWPWTLSLLSPGQYQVIQNISIDKLISTLDIVNWYIKNWYHHSQWLAFGVGFFVSIPRGDLLWERYAWRPCRWGCLEPLQGDLSVAKCVVLFPVFALQSGSFAMNQSQRCTSRCPYSAIF